MQINENEIKRIVSEVLKNINVDNTSDIKNISSNTYSSVSGNGIFNSMDEAIQKATIAQKELLALSIEKREEIIIAMREAAINNVEKLASLGVEDTGMGRVEDKIQKNLLAAQKTPGVEDCYPEAYSGDWGLTLVERAPYGVIGAITPSTNPSETIICNGIGMIAAGNSVVFNGHPGAKNITNFTVELLNKAIVAAGGPANLMATVSEPTIKTGGILMKHPGIRLLVVTGGPAVVNAAFASGKKVIAAGPGNPPVIVDETADLKQAAKDIVSGATLDNNILCIAEKEIIALSSIADELKQQLINAGSYLLTDNDISKLEKVILTPEGNPNRKFVGKNADFILSQIGIKVGYETRMILCETRKDHPFVQEELLMPVIPLVRVSTLKEAISFAVEVEHGFAHTAMMHSKNIEHLHLFAKAINTSIFVKNGPSYAGLGFTGEGPTTFSIASPTGEGITTARTFTRQRRCVLKDYFRIV